ncbi:MAG: hypothetical protein GY866_21565, partial [Proteobacteria bacterium]|nr:hypothetical protein [Pseudomonadota bacterium]
MEELKKSGITLEDKLAAVDWTEVGVKDDFKDPLKDPNVVEMFKLIREHGAGVGGSAKKVSTLLQTYADEAEKTIFADNPDNITIDDALGTETERGQTDKKDLIANAADELDFATAQKKNSEAGYKQYIEKYPEGKFAKLAQDKLKQLSGPSEDDPDMLSF